MPSSRVLQSRRLRLPVYLLVLCALCVALLPSQRAAHSQIGADAGPIRLRRATIDTANSVAQPSLSAATVDANESLLLVQFDGPPNDQDRAQLEAAGLHPLIDVPEQALLVRAQPGQMVPTTLAGVRWIGPYASAYRIAADLESQLQRPNTALDVRLIAAPDANLPMLREALSKQGVKILSESFGLTGTSMHVQLLAGTLTGLLHHPDILWAERYHMPQLLNDSARSILGVDIAHSQNGLDGAGQVIAITDSGLDSQTALSADFSGRLVRGFGNREMGFESNPFECTANNWSDRHGHGTHVSGIAVGNGALSAGQFAGMAPAAGIIIQSVSTGGNSLNCLAADTSFLQKAYDAGARIQNGSYGSPASGDPNGNGFGGYTDDDAQVDSFLWQHPEHLFVVAAGNSGKDTNGDGITDRDSINTPATAKNVLSVGASENEHSVNASSCSFVAEHLCWRSFGFSFPASVADDSTSNNRNGMAAWSSRGPTDDGRIKPEIVAPGTTIIAARSHDPSSNYGFTYNANYAYDWGTSMSTPAISGMAALVRQWLTEERNLANPSAALLKALLLNGATDMSPGQYGTGIGREIPAAWPNNTQGWGRASMPDTLGLNNQTEIWFVDNKQGLAAGSVAEYRLKVLAGQPLHLTLSWTDFPGTPLAAKALVNNLDLELLLPDGTTLMRGNANADLPASCRAINGADTCNTSESIVLSAPVSGDYRVRVQASAVSLLAVKQPFAIAMRAQQVDIVTLTAPVLTELSMVTPSSLRLSWSAVSGAEFYTLEASQSANFSPPGYTDNVSVTSTTRLQEPGTSYYRVRACYSGGCGLPSNVRAYTTTIAPERMFLPSIIAQ